MKVKIEVTPMGTCYYIKCEQVKITRGELAFVLDAEQAEIHGDKLLRAGLEFFKPNPLEHIYFLKDGGGKKIEDLGVINIY